MRILLAAHALPPDTHGGTELYTTRLATEFAARGHTVTVAAPRGTDAEVEGATVVGLPDVVDRPEDGVAFTPAGDTTNSVVDNAVVDLLETFDPDVVHLQHLKGLSPRIPALCADHGVTCILTLHDFWTLCHREQLRQPDGTRCSGPTSIEKCTTCYAEYVSQHVLESNFDAPSQTASDGEGVKSIVAEPVAHRTDRLRRALEACDRLVAPSRYLRDVFVRYGTDPARIVQLRNGIQTDRFQTSTFDPDEPLQVGYAGRVAESKGVHLLVHAIDHVPNAELHVYGQFNPDEEPYHARLRETVGDRVRFHGWYAAAADVFADLDVFVLPSVWVENSPLVIQEAFAAGVPVVTSDIGGMTELVTDGVDGLTVPVSNRDALAAALERLATDPDLVRRLRAGVEPPTDLADHADELLALYREHGTATADPGRGGKVGRTMDDLEYTVGEP